MPDRKYTYTVEIDAATAQAAARKLRDTFEREMAQGAGGQGGGVNTQAQEAARQQATASKAAAAQAIEAARQQTTQVRALQQQQTAVVKAETAERVAAAQQEARLAGEAARMARAMVEGEQKRLTATTVAEIRKREREERAAARTTGGGTTFGTAARGIGGTLRGIDNALMFAGGGLAAFGAYQVGTAAYDAGRQGAQLERTSELLDVVAQRLGVTAGGMRGAIVGASGGTMTGAAAESLSLQMLSQRWAGQRPDITNDAAIMAEAARKFSMLYPDSEGRAQSAGDVSAKLLSYIREGNKELVDQFNINNAAIAKAAGVPNENLTAEDRARGLFKILQEEIDRLPESVSSAADEIAQSEARFSDAMSRMQRAMAGPTAGAATLAADLVEGAIYGVPKERQLATADTAITNQRMWRDMNVFSPEAQDNADEQIRRLEMMQMATKQVFEAMKAQTDGAGDYAAAMDAIAQSVAQTNGVSDEQLGTLIEINNWFTRATAAGGGYAESLEGVGRAINNIIPMAENARLSLVALAGQMAAGLQLNVSLNTANPTWAAQADLAGRTRYVPGTGMVAVDPFTTAPIGENLRALGGGTRTDMLPNPRAEAERQSMYDTRDLREQNRREAEQAANEAARKWASAADKAANAFEQAAEDAASAFESALQAVPGLFGTSSVTAEDMADAEAGVYQPKADEYLRQLRDEVLNAVDRPNVNLADIAGAAGIDQSLDPKAQLRLIERMWEDSSLFANPGAMRFLNTDAVDVQLANQEKSEQGRRNLMAQFGLDPDSPLDAAGKSAFAEMIGMGDETEIQGAAREAKETFAAEFAKPASGEGASTGQAFLQELVGSLDADLIGGEVLETLNGIGAGILDGIKAGYDKAAQNADWSTPVVASLAEQVAPMVLAMIEDQI